MRGTGVMLRVTALEPAVPVARLVPGTEVYVAPRLRVRPAAAAAANGNLLPAAQQPGDSGNGRPADQQQGCSGASSGQQQKGVDGEDAAAPPLQAVLRVQLLGAATTFWAQQSAQPQAAGQQLPPGMQRVLASAATLARCGLRPGDWVRLSGRSTRSLVKFATLAASELAAPGHLALTAEQSEWAGAPPFSPIRLQRLTRSQRQLVTQAAELQGGANGSINGSGGAAKQSNDASHPASRDVLEQEQQEQQEQGQQQPGSLPAAAMGSASWLRQGTEQALRHLLPILGFTPRSLLQVRRTRAPPLPAGCAAPVHAAICMSRSCVPAGALCPARNLTSTCLPLHLQSWGAPRPGGLLVCGPAGSGKSALLAAAAAALQQHPECLTYTVTISCRDISAESARQAQAQILPKVGEQMGGSLGPGWRVRTSFGKQRMYAGPS